MPAIRRLKRNHPPVSIWFGWSIVLMALSLVLAILLLARYAEGSPKLEAWTQNAIRRLPVYHEDRSSDQRSAISDQKEAQLSAIALAVAKASQKAPLPPRQWAALLLTIGFHESAFSLRIHAGNCKPRECDRGKARGPWQNHRNAFNRDVWDKLHGTEHTDSQVWAADYLLRRVVVTCANKGTGPSVPGILTAYAGRQCFKDWPGLNERLATFGRINP